MHKWRECSTYTKILLAIIKLSHFMVIQTALIANADPINYNALLKGRCLESVANIIDRFII